MISVPEWNVSAGNPPAAAEGLLKRMPFLNAVLERGAHGPRINPAYLLAAIVLVLGIQNLILLRFLGIATAPVVAAASTLLLAVTAYLARLKVGERSAHPTLVRFATCAVISILLYLLGGEGRLFYANYDWQIRDAVLNDMIRHPWPFAYMARGSAEVLRAPIGMYLLPSLAGKLGGMAAADLALLIQNSLMLAVLLTLASLLLETVRSRLFALVVFLAFSGLDFLGQLLANSAKALDPTSHIEFWANLQFSSTVTLAFWAPQHALVGWFGAGLFLLWKRGLLPLCGFLAPMPLFALWSPLALVGMVPFAFFALLNAVTARRLRWEDILFSASTTLLSFPALLYLQTAGDTVGFRFNPVPLNLYVVFQVLEVLPYVAALWAVSRGGRFGWITLAIVTLCLATLPLIQVGESTDLMMRASIPALAILALMTAEAIRRKGGGSRWCQAWRRILITTLLLGSITPAHEVMRALVMRPSPYPQCSLTGSWDAILAPRATSKSTYLAPVSALPEMMRPLAPHRVLHEQDPQRCWSRPWQISRSMN